MDHSDLKTVLNAGSPGRDTSKSRMITIMADYCLETDDYRSGVEFMLRELKQDPLDLVLNLHFRAWLDKVGEDLIASLLREPGLAEASDAYEVLREQGEIPFRLHELMVENLRLNGKEERAQVILEAIHQITQESSAHQSE